MATAETVELNAPHAPKAESIKLFNDIESELKQTLIKYRHDANKHEPEYYVMVKDLSDKQLTSFSSDDLKLVRVGTSAYGLHIFGKVFIPESKSGYIHFRAFAAGDETKLHSIHTEEKENPEDGSKSFRAIFKDADELEWFDT